MADLTPAQQMAAAGGYKNYNNQTRQPAAPSGGGGGRGGGNFWTNLKPQSTPVQNKLATGPIVGPATGNIHNVYLGQRDGRDVIAPINDARYMIHTLDEASRNKLYKMADAWYGKGVWKPSWLNKLWENAINVSANAYAYANQRIDPVTAFGMVIRTGNIGDNRSGGSGGGGGGYGGGGGGGTSTAVATSTALTNATEAETIFDNALSTYLGRKATKQEQSAFLKALNKKEAKNPTVTTQTVTSTGKSTQQQSVSAGGFNPSTFAENYAQQMEGSAEYQAATGIMDSFISALKAQV